MKFRHVDTLWAPRVGWHSLCPNCWRNEKTFAVLMNIDHSISSAQTININNNATINRVGRPFGKVISPGIHCIAFLRASFDLSLSWVRVQQQRTERIQAAWVTHKKSCRFDESSLRFASLLTFYNALKCHTAGPANCDRSPITTR